MPGLASLVFRAATTEAFLKMENKVPDKARGEDCPQGSPARSAREMIDHEVGRKCGQRQAMAQLVGKF